MNKTILLKNNYLNITDCFEIPPDFVQCILHNKQYNLVVCCYEPNADFDVMQSIYRYAQSLNGTILDFLNLRI